MPRALPRALACALAALSLAACDATPGAPAVLPERPALSNFALAPDTFALGAAAPQAQIPLALAVDLVGPEGSSVRYYVRRQGADSLVAEGALAAAGGTRYRADTLLALPRGATGLYAVTLLALDPDGRPGAQAVGLFRFTADPLGPPVVEAVEAPARVVRPGELRVVATVRDPDGSANLVAVDLVGPTGRTTRLRDDGPRGASGNDEVAGDGRYTAVLNLGSADAAGPSRYAVVARDVEGQENAAAAFTVTIE